jgi:hypothetical protein
MDKKLTLNLDENVIHNAKSQKTSLSRLIESYLNNLTSERKPNTDSSPLVDSLGGVISVDKDYDFKEGYIEYLMNKDK